MSNWYYYDNNGQKQGPITGGQLKGLAKMGTITPGTMVETEDGKAVPAIKIKGLTFVEAVQPQPNVPVLATPSLPPAAPPPLFAFPTQATVPIPPPPKRRSRRNLLLALGALFLLVMVGRFIAPGIMRHIPVLNTLAPVSYQRGTGSYVVRYADRSYDQATWKMVWSTENAENVHELYSIGGWDANNLAVGAGGYSSCGVVLRDGHWIVSNKKIQYPYYADTNTFYAYNNDGTLCRFTPSGYSVVLDDHARFYFCKFCQLDRDYFQVVNGLRNSLYESTNGETFSRVVTDEKRAWIWKNDNTNTKHLVANEFEFRSPFHSFAHGRALALAYNGGRMLQYKGGLWYEHYEVSLERPKHLWAIDEENFILVGDGISRFRNGKEDHPTVTALGESFDSAYLVSWGVNMDKFWVLDIKGNVAQFDQNGVRAVVRGPKLDRDRFQDAWVSPEGVVYAITKKEVYRLD